MRVEEVLGDVVDELERVFAALAALGTAFAAIGGSPRRADLATLRPAILELLEAHIGLVTGAGVIAAPGLLADAPRWLEWWWRSGRGGPEPLRVNLDPAAPDFYDYTTTDWFTVQGPRMSGPYVDYACTNEYAITLASPVHAGARRIGVAAADVLVASLERRVLPPLLELGRPMALTSGDGRVIASTVPELAPGMRVEPTTGSPPGAWLLVEPSLS
jgi:hypothetical protein